MSFKPETAVYTPPEVSAYGLQAIEDVQNNGRRGLCIGIPSIRDYFAPVRPGQLAMLIAQTSNYKTGMLHYLEAAAARQLVRDGRTDEVIIHVSVEENIEEQAYLLLGRETGESAGDLARGIVQDWDRLREAAISLGTVPIYRIGESLARAEDLPRLTISNMIRSIKMLVSGEITGTPLKVAGLFFDYLQAFPLDEEVKRERKLDQRRLQVMEDVDRLRRAAFYFDCPVWVASQAKQDIAGRRGQLMLPNVYDGKEASEIGSRPDRVISQWMPKADYPLGTVIRQDGNPLFTVTENLILIKVLKQKPGLPSGRSWVCHIKFDTNEIAPITDEGRLWE